MFDGASGKMKYGDGQARVDEVEIFGQLAPMVAGMSEADLAALADRAEAHCSRAAGGVRFTPPPPGLRAAALRAA